MGNQADKKFTWVIKNFSSLGSNNVYSDVFEAGRCKWGLLAYPKGYNNINIYDYFSLYIYVPNSKSLPSGWRRHAKFSFTMVTQIPGELSLQREAEYWFDQKNTTRGFQSMFLLSEIQSSHKGFLVNGEVKIVAEVDVLEVIGIVDVPEKPESFDINGFQVPASQVDSVNSLFKKYPGFASKVCPKNPHLKKTYLNVVLSLNEIMCKSPDKLSNGDLADAYSALRYVTKAGFKLDWLEMKLKETGKTRLQEIEEDLKDLKVKCADMNALLEFLR
ncbi:MATH domain and coiled-coil domain-containing protein At3g27040 [Arabidopsis lyrata subsp. lyrata]|uniref:MATH domain and coiled-coil domain-containing protein At3g27040 n=1 Tax=Arabidopsis lyrata subsp. lyrata TaxID=81972 RepID=UPI000A29B0F1|nr:MATH domain and coiled-coil domain-containing protein At3g27040 [Arabidopsis lyrata subsp. lyrata]|eukprot:XP_020882410.1 MATH domain and coiled-coil domain-containing protein At3g27040 [Arabidopsis lyrata subsp. lyrata]